MYNLLFTVRKLYKCSIYNLFCNILSLGLYHHYGGGTGGTGGTVQD